MLVIINGKIYTSAGKVFSNGYIVIENGVIQKVDDMSNYSELEEATTIDAKGKVITPGLVDPHSHIGGFGPMMKSQDVNEMTNNATPEVEVLYGIDSEHPIFNHVIKSGITTSVIAPGSGNVIGGMVCAVKSAGANIMERCIKNPVALKMALGGNPKGVYGPRQQMPMTRMGIAQVIRDNLNKGLEYMNKKEQANGNPEKMPKYDMGLENIEKVLKREIPIKVHCEQFDMLTTIKIAEEFNILYTIDHAWGASDYYDEFEQSKNLVGIIYGPIGVYLTPGECGKVDINSLIELEDRGICCSIMTDGPILDSDLLIYQAGEVVRYGMDPEKAIELITINGAKIAGISERVGSIEVGKDADIVIFNNMPTVETNAKAICTIIDGKIVYRDEFFI